MKVRHNADEFWDEPDDADLALLRHVMCLDDEPPQGLHRGGWKSTEQEDEQWWDYRYPRGLDDEW